VSGQNFDIPPTPANQPGLPEHSAYRSAYRSIWIAYALLLFGGGGGLGLHRFYLGYRNSATVLLTLSLAVFLLPMAGIYSITLTSYVVIAWIALDLMLIPRLTRLRNAAIADEIDRALEEKVELARSS
jgi:fatty acid desaturase